MPARRSRYSRRQKPGKSPPKGLFPPPAWFDRTRPYSLATYPNDRGVPYWSCACEANRNEVVDPSPRRAGVILASLRLHSMVNSLHGFDEWAGLPVMDGLCDRSHQYLSTTRNPKPRSTQALSSTLVSSCYQIFVPLSSQFYPFFFLFLLKKHLVTPPSFSEILSSMSVLTKYRGWDLKRDGFLSFVYKYLPGSKLQLSTRRKPTLSSLVPDAAKL